MDRYKRFQNDLLGPEQSQINYRTKLNSNVPKKCVYKEKIGLLNEDLKTKIIRPKVKMSLLTCPMCLNLISNPVECEKCKKKVCNKCITDYLYANQGNCFCCNQKFEKSEIMKKGNNFLDKSNSLENKFKNRDRGSKEIKCCSKIKDYEVNWNVLVKKRVERIQPINYFGIKSIIKDSLPEDNLYNPDKNVIIVKEKKKKYLNNISYMKSNFSNLNSSNESSKSNDNVLPPFTNLTLKHHGIAKLNLNQGINIRGKLSIPSIVNTTEMTNNFSQDSKRSEIMLKNIKGNVKETILVNNISLIPNIKLNGIHLNSMKECECCGSYINIDYGIYCEKCNKFACSSKSKFCKSCSLECSKCKKKICDFCIITCSQCFERICKDCHLKFKCECILCSRIGCINCCKICKLCNNIICQYCLKKCNNYKEFFSYNCVRSCIKCQLLFCKLCYPNNRFSNLQLLICNQCSDLIEFQKRISMENVSNDEKQLNKNDLNEFQTAKAIKNISLKNNNVYNESTQIKVKSIPEEIEKEQRKESIKDTLFNMDSQENNALIEIKIREQLNEYPDGIEKNKLIEDSSSASKRKIIGLADNDNSLLKTNRTCLDTNNLSFTNIKIDSSVKIDLDTNQKNTNNFKINDLIIEDKSNRLNGTQLSFRIIHNFGNGVFHTFLIKQMNLDFESHIKIVKSFNGTGIGIGLYSGDEKFVKVNELLGYQQEGYCFWMFSGMKCNKKIDVAYSEPYFQSDIIGMVFKNNNLEFIRNGEKLGLAFSNIKMPVYISACSQYNGDEFEIIDIKNL